jgi:hypothetical protein
MPCKMQVLGASAPEIMALGHWRSGAWSLYSRRNGPRLQAWAKQILHKRRPGDIRSKQAIRRLVSAGVGKDGGYITTNGHEKVCAAEDDVENDIDWDDNEVVECDGAEGALEPGVSNAKLPSRQLRERHRNPLLTLQLGYTSSYSKRSYAPSTCNGKCTTMS